MGHTTLLRRRVARRNSAGRARLVFAMATGAALSCLHPLSVAAATKTYVGGAIGNWNDPNAWSPVGVPQAGDVVTLDPATAAAYTVNYGTGTAGSIQQL